MMGGFRVGPGAGGGLAPLFDLENTIIQETPTRGQWAFATDTGHIFLGDGSAWQMAPFALVVKPAAIDMGYLQGSSRIGYGLDYLADKLLSNVIVGSNEGTQEGGVRTYGGTFQIYLNGTWNDIVINFRLREKASAGYRFEHQPIGFTEWIEIMSGNGETLGLNGLPLVQGYNASMGAYPVPVQIDGGTF